MPRFSLVGSGFQWLPSYSYHGPPNSPYAGFQRSSASWFVRKNPATGISAAGTTKSSERAGARQSNSSNSATANEAAGSSIVAVNAANRPARTNDQDGAAAPSRQTRSAGTRANSVVQVATV